MSDSTSLGFLLPDVLGDEDLWGDHTNANWQLADALLSRPSVTVADAAPAFAPGRLWFDSVGGQLYVGYDDGSSQQFVAASNNFQGATPQLYQGGWNASTNTPTLASGALVNGVVAPSGNYFVVTVGATTAPIDGTTTWAAGDYVVSNGTTWQRVQMSGAYLPTAGGTVTGLLSLTGAGTALSVTNNATIGGILTAGSGGGNTTALQISGSSTGRTTLFASGSATDRSIFIQPAGAGTTRVVGLDQPDRVQINPLGGGTAWSGANAQDPTKMVLSIAAPISGSVTDTTHSLSPMSLTISGDTLGMPTNATGSVATASFIHNFGGAGTIGNRIGINNQMTQTAAFDPSAPGPFANSFVGATNFVHATSTNGGTSYTAMSGGLEAINNIVTMEPAAVFYNGAVAIENDMNIKAGASVGDKIGVWVISSLNDAVQGNYTDAAFMVAQNPSATNTNAGWRQAYGFGMQNNSFPMDATNGVILGSLRQTNLAGAPLSAAYKRRATSRGVDFSDIEFAAAAFAAPGFMVDGAGALNLSNFVVAQIAAGLSIDAPKQRVTAAAVNGTASGATCFVGDRLYGPNGGIYRIDTVGGTGGQQATGTLTVLFPGVTASPPANPVTMTGTNASNVSVNLTWGAANGLSLNPTGQRIGFNGTAPIAKPAASGSRSGNAALASLLTALASYGLITDSTTA